MLLRREDFAGPKDSRTFKRMDEILTGSDRSYLQALWKWCADPFTTVPREIETLFGPAGSRIPGIQALSETFLADNPYDLTFEWLKNKKAYELKNKKAYEKIEPLFVHARLIAGGKPGIRRISVNMMRILLETSYALKIHPEAAVDLLVDEGYHVVQNWRCRACKAMNLFYAVGCSSCGESLDDKRVRCPNGHENPNLTRFCLSQLNGGCGKQIRYGI